MSAPRIALAPEGIRGWLADAIEAGGGTVVPAEEADGLVWAEPAKARELDELLHHAASKVRWVQLPWAGIEPYVDIIHDDRIWTCGKGVYAEPVAEHALTLLLAGCEASIATSTRRHGHRRTARTCSAPRS